MLQALGRREPLTATEAGEMIGESPTTCSFHLRTLAKYGFVEEAEKGRGRRRPWRRTHVGSTFPALHPDALYPDALHPDPETSLAAGALDQVLSGMMLDHVRRVLADQPRLSAEQLSVTGVAEAVAYVTVEEAQRLKTDLWALINSYRERQEDHRLRPENSIPLEMLVFTYPLELGEPDRAA